MRYDRRGEGGGGEGVPFLVQRVHDSRRYNSEPSRSRYLERMPIAKPANMNQEHNGGGGGKFVVTLLHKDSKHQDHAQDRQQNE